MTARHLLRIGKPLATLTLLGFLGACGGANDTLVLEDTAPETIYQRAELKLASGDPDDAAVLFAEIERLYPYSDFAKRGLIMQAFSYYKDRDYENARAAAQRFIDFYPADEDAAYAQYLLALSYYDQIDQVGRDQGLTFQALQSLRTVIEQYPDSEYARSSIHTPEALMRLVEAYLSLGLTDEAQTAAAILGYNFQSSPFYDDAYRQLTGRGLAPEAKGTSWLRDIYRRTVQGRWL